MDPVSRERAGMAGCTARRSTKPAELLTHTLRVRSISTRLQGLRYRLTELRSAYIHPPRRIQTGAYSVGTDTNDVRVPDRRVHTPQRRRARAPPSTFCEVQPFGPCVSGGATAALAELAATACTVSMYIHALYDVVWPDICAWKAKQSNQGNLQPNRKRGAV